MVSWNAVQEVDVGLFLLRGHYALDDAEIIDGGLERRDIAHISEFEFRLVRLAISLGEECRLQGDVKEQSGHLFVPGTGVVRDISVDILDKYISKRHYDFILDCLKYGFLYSTAFPRMWMAVSGEKVLPPFPT